jgi:protocatechuate 4,5-dioxygenase, beta chain
MATIVGGITSSHVPAIGRAIARHLQADPYWKPFFDGFPPVHAWLERVKPDVAVVIYNDHGLNFFLDKMPTFAVGAAPEYRNADEGWGIPTVPPFAGELDLSWHLIDSLVSDEFDITTCQEMLVDHAFTLPMALLWPGSGAWPVTTVPVCVNTVQFPLPSAKRCWALGQAVGRAVASWPRDKRVVIIGTGGLSHQLDGQRAGFINKDFDLKFMASLVDDPTWATQYSVEQLVELAGTQGVELLMWLATRGALQGARPGPVRRVHSNYHIPISNTAAGLLVLEAA